MSLLVMVTEDGFYPVEAAPFILMDKQAADHGQLNQHVIRVEDAYGNTLWKKCHDA